MSWPVLKLMFLPFPSGSEHGHALQRQYIRATIWLMRRGSALKSCKSILLAFLWTNESDEKNQDTWLSKMRFVYHLNTILCSTSHRSWNSQVYSNGISARGKL